MSRPHREIRYFTQRLVEGFDMLHESDDSFSLPQIENTFPDGTHGILEPLEREDVRYFDLPSSKPTKRNWQPRGLFEATQRRKNQTTSKEGYQADTR